MGRRFTPLVAATLALGWLISSVVDCHVLAAFTAGCAIAAACFLAPRRRRATWHALGISVLGLVTTSFLVAMASIQFAPVTAFLIQLGYAVLLFPLIPVLYAVGFASPDDRDSP